MEGSGPIGACEAMEGDLPYIRGGDRDQHGAHDLVQPLALGVQQGIVDHLAGQMLEERGAWRRFPFPADEGASAEQRDVLRQRRGVGCRGVGAGERVDQEGVPDHAGHLEGEALLIREPIQPDQHGPLDRIGEAQVYAGQCRVLQQIPRPFEAGPHQATGLSEPPE